MAMPTLTHGALERILQGEEVEQPVLQILGLKKLPGGGGQDGRMRLLISDGKHLNSYAMLATQLNHLHDEGQLIENTVIRIDKYITSAVGGTKRVLVILEITIIKPGGECTKIGDPKNVSVAAPSNAPPAANERAPPKVTSNNNNRQTPTINHNSSAMSQSLNSSLTHPIASLSPYQNKWVIRVRVTSKSPMRTWSNAKGEGKLFSMDLLDESGEIRATAFKEQADKFYNEIETGQVYYISKCQLKPANKQYSTLNNDYEMTFTSETVVQKCDDEEGSIPEIQYNLVPITQIATIEPKAAVDIIGICKEVGELQTFTARSTNKELQKRDLVLVDQSNASVNYTLWGEEAAKFNGDSNPVILIKGARVNEFNGGKSIGSGTMQINPDRSECHQLKGWFENGGAANITNLISAPTGIGGSNIKTEWLTFHEVQKRNLGNGEKADYFQCKATVHVTKSQNAFYKACPQPECNKKVVDESNGHYRCERCNAVFPNFKYRLLLQMSIADWTSNRWVTCFNEVAEQLLGRSSTEVGEAVENNTMPVEAIFSKPNFETYIFKLRAKVEMYGDTARTKLTIQSHAPVNYHEYNKYLINNLKQLTGIEKN